VSPTAVQVVVTTPYHDFFGGTSANLYRSATAVINAPTAQFSIGSTLVMINANLGRFGVANLSALGYNGLASGSVTLDGLRTQLGFAAGSPDSILQNKATVGQLLSAYSTLLSASDPTASVALTSLYNTLQTSWSATFNTQVTLGQALGIAQGQGTALSTQVNFLQAVGGIIQIANGLAGISASLSVSLPNLGSASMQLVAINPATVSPMGPVGTTATNDAVVITVNATLNLSILGTGVTAQLPLTFTLGGATGTLQAINCSGSTPTSLQVSTAFPQTIAVTVGSGSATASILGLGLVSVGVTGSGSVSSSPVPNTTIANPANWGAAGTPAWANSNLSTASATLTATGSLGTISQATLTTSLQTALAPMLAPLMNASGSALGSSALGINVGNAAYLGIQANCGSGATTNLPQLAQ
jgi:uncharacterized membrane protein